MIVGVDGTELQGAPTGTGRYLRNLLRIWADAGDARILVYTKGSMPPEGARVHPRLEWRHAGTTAMRGLQWQHRALPGAVHADGVDVLFSPAYTCPLRLACPRVTAVHDLSFYFWPSDFALVDAVRRRVLTAASIRASRAILACSAFTRTELIRRFPDAASRIHHVLLGPDDDLPAAPEREEARRRLGIGGVYAISVGSVLNRRRVPELLIATAHLARRFPGLRLDVVGDNRTHPRLGMEQLVRDTGTIGNVRVAGFVSEDQLALRYAAADLVFALSEYEGFGLPAVEAMARGVPLVAADRPALSEIVADAALLVDPADPREIASAAARILTDARLAASLQARALARAQSFSWRRAAADTWRVLAEAAA